MPKPKIIQKFEGGHPLQTNIWHKSHFESLYLRNGTK